MRIPSTSDLVESQTNKAYDKLAVLSENLDKLEDIYDFIFKYHEYLRQRLAQYVTLDLEETITGLKTFQNDVKFLSNVEFPKIDIPHDSDSTYTGKLSVHYADNDGKVPALILTCGNTKVAKICLGWNTETNKPILIIPDTVEDFNSSAVTVAYIKSTVSNIMSILEQQYVTKDSMSTYLEPYALKADLESLRVLVNQKANQSDLDALRDQVNNTTTITNIKGLFWAQQKTYSHSTEGGDIIIMPEIGQKYPGNELYQNCTYDEASRTLVLSDPLNEGSYMCVDPSRLYLGCTPSGSVYNGNTTTSDIYSKSYERGVFAPVRI